MQRIGLFIPAPPEHNAHVINSVSLFSALRQLHPQTEFVWLTMNPRDPSTVLSPQALLSEYGLEEYRAACDVPVYNCAHLVQDEFHPQVEEIEDFIARFDLSGLYMHFYPPFWETVRQICAKHGIPFGLHVKIFYRKPGLPFYFQHDDRALQALQNIDFLSVSQDQDAQELAQTFDIPRDKMIVMPKSVPQEILAQARKGEMPESLKDKLQHLLASQPNSIQLGYVGRFEELKNIVWFLRNCMPQLEDLAEKFHLTLVGTGSLQAEVIQISQQYTNVSILPQVLGYQEALSVLAHFDAVLYPSGFDFAPRFPLESFLLGKPCFLTDVHFNHRYRPYGLMVPASHDQDSLMAYNGAKICFAIPDALEMVRQVRAFIVEERPPFGVPPQLDQESNPLFSAQVLMTRMQQLIETSS